MKLTTGYKKPIASSGTDALELSSNNSYLLLAGGGHKALSELVSPADLTTELSNYVTIGSNQTITGVKTFSLIINADISGNADTVDGEHAAAFAHIGAHNNLTVNNEFTFASSGFSGDIWFNYRTAGGTNGNITDYIFGNGKGGQLYSLNTIATNASTAYSWGNHANVGYLLRSDIGSLSVNYATNAGNAGTLNGHTSDDFVLKTTHDVYESVIVESLNDLDNRKIEISDIPASLPASDVYDWAKAANKPSYSFNEITPGVVTIGDGENRLLFRTNANWASGVYYSGPGNESLVFANMNPITSWIFANANPTANTDWRYLTPSLQIKNGRVTINKLIASDTDASYNLDINGSANATTLYENGVRVSVSGHTHTKSEIPDFPASLPANGGNADTINGYSSSDFVLNTNYGEFKSVVATALTDLDRRIDEAIPTIEIGTVTTVDAGKDAQVESHVTGNKVVLDFSIPRGEQGDMKELDDEGSDSCKVGLQWVYSNPNLSGTFADMIQVPVPSVEAMVMEADCIKQTKQLTLNVGESIFQSQYTWKELHWLLRCSNTDCIVYTAKLATHDTSFPSVEGAITNRPPTTVEISVSLQEDPELRYVQVTVENMYGRAYYIQRQ